METALHRQLKTRFGPDVGGRSEVTLAGFRIDAVDPDGSLVEVQSGALGPLRAKLTRLLLEHRVRVVKPVVVSKRVVRRARRDGPDQSSRMSPKRGAALDVFDDLVGLIRLVPHPNLRIDVMEVSIDEIRVPRRRWPGFAVVDRRLREEIATITIQHPSDLWNLIPAPLPDRFSTVDLAEAIGRPMALAQKVAYCLRWSGAAEPVGKNGNRIVYERRD
ncbi:MAG: hypothetical protein JWN86_3784 [Planctomycetota bacterium]|nr:hypothetical protein [Planctomycetota bacterium]